MPNRAERRKAAKDQRRGVPSQYDQTRGRARSGMLDEYALQEKSRRIQEGVDDSGRRPVSTASRNEVLIGLGVALLLGLALGLAMARLTEAVYPWPDALLTAFSLLAQLWMALKRWQCWLLWIVVDVLYVGFFAFQGYWLTAGLYGVFTALAVLGLREWRTAR